MRTIKRAGIAAAIMAAIGILAGVWVLTKDIAFIKTDEGKIDWDNVELVDKEKDQLFAMHSRDIREIDITVREVDYSYLDEAEEEAAIEDEDTANDEVADDEEESDEVDADGDDEAEEGAEEEDEDTEADEPELATDEDADEEGAGEEPEPGPGYEAVEERRLALARVDERWMLTSPLHALAEQGAADGLATAIAELRIKGRHEDLDPLDPKYGLDNPSVTVRIKRRRDEDIELRIGRDTAIGSDIYMMVVGDNTLYYASSSIKSSLAKEPKDLREKKVVDFDPDDVERVILDTKGKRIVCEQEGTKENKEWWLSKPVQARADDYNVGDLVDEVKGIEAKEFVDEIKSLATFGLDKPSIVARLDFGKGKDDVVVMLGKRIKKKLEDDDTSFSVDDDDDGDLTDLVYCMARGRDEVFLVDAEVADNLTKDPIDLRDTDIVDFENSKLTRVEVTRRKGLSFVLVKADAKWRIEKPEYANADFNEVDNLLWNLKDLQASEFFDDEDVSPTVTGLNSPRITISLHIEDEDDPTVVKFGYQEKDGVRYYCGASTMRGLALVDDTFLDALPDDIDDLKEEAEEDEDAADDMQTYFDEAEDED